MTGAQDYRVVLLAPTRRDAAVATRLMTRAEIAVVACSSFEMALREVEAGAATLIVPEEAVSVARNARLAAVVAAQQPWSDLPILVLARSGADSEALERAVTTLGNVTLLERPLRMSTLLSTVRTAIRARQRQYQIREYLAERARAEAALRTADRRKDEFLATLGHELRNPLAPLLSGVDLLRRHGLGDERAQRAIAVMERQITHLTGLVDDLLEVSRITRGLIQVRRRPLDLSTAIRAAVDTVQPLIEAGRHQLTVDLPAAPLVVSGDSLRLTQVFANLLTNAAKYTPPGGRLSVAARPVAGRAQVVVEDNGIGIAASHLAVVFDMFVQVDRAHRQAQGGLGIGLTLVKSLVELHGGCVDAASAGEGLGSTFTVSLPLSAAAEATAAAPVAPLTCQGRRILIVDDNRDAAEMLAALFAAYGADVRTALDGREALAALEEFAADSVVLDIGMPHMDGYEVARRIRRQPAHADMVIVALSGWGQDRDIQRSREAGFDHHIVKPPAIDRLVAAIVSGRAAAR